jgi:hypothetical protein
VAVNPSTVGLYNLALALLGGEQLFTVDSTWEQNTLGILCNNHFPAVLDQALEAHPWSFARDRKDLAQTGRQNQTQAGRSYRWRYALPSDCLRPVELTGGRPFVLEGRHLLTDADQAELIYVRRVEDPREWPPAFRTALAWGLAVVLASARNNDPRKQQMCLQQYQRALGEAMARDNNMQQPAEELSAWELARLGR